MFNNSRSLDGKVLSAGRKHSKMVFKFFNTLLKALVLKFFKPFFNAFVKVPKYARTSCRADAGAVYDSATGTCCWAKVTRYAKTRNVPE